VYTLAELQWQAKCLCLVGDEIDPYTRHLMLQTTSGLCGSFCILTASIPIVNIFPQNIFFVLNGALQLTAHRK
jgi:hypothetical protein